MGFSFFPSLSAPPPQLSLSKINKLKKNSLEGLNGRFELPEGRINESEGRSTEIIQSEELKEKKNKQNEHFRGLGNTFKHINSHLTGVPKGDSREKSAIKNIKRNNG